MEEAHFRTYCIAGASANVREGIGETLEILEENADKHERAQQRKPLSFLAGKFAQDRSE